MGYKETCPGCNSHTSDIAQAFFNDQPCPTCGLSAAAAREIMVIRQARADEAIKAEFEKLRLRADRAEQSRDALQECVNDLRETLRQFDERMQSENRREWNER